MTGLKRFESAVAGPASKVALQIVRSDRPATERWLSSVLLGVEQQVPQTPPSLRRDDLFIVRLLKWFSEVDSSVATLEVVAKLARRATAVGVEPAAQLRLFVEAYLNEVYILSERCDALATFVERAYRKDRRAQAVRSSIRALGRAVHQGFAPMLGARGAHVHESRYEDFDFDVRRLGTLKILGPTDAMFARIHKATLRDARRKKVQWMVANNRTVRDMLDDYFDQMYDLVFDANGDPVYPVPATERAERQVRRAG